jgi:hypothetical protein
VSAGAFTEHQRRHGRGRLQDAGRQGRY